MKTARSRIGSKQSTGWQKRKNTLWQCPRCRRRFANRNQSHFCGRYRLDLHLRGKPPHIRKLYELFVERVRHCGRVTVIPEKTRIAFQVRMSFAALRVQHSALVGHLVLAERHPLSCFTRIDSISPRNHVHHFRLIKQEDMTDELCACLRKAYLVGEQKHLHFS